MTSRPIVIQPQRDVAEAARLMTERAVNRLPVVEADEKLVGIVTRAVRVFVRSDDEVAHELREDVLLDTLWIDPATGEVATKADARLREHLATRVPGVVSVRSELRWRVDEPRLPPARPARPHPAREVGRSPRARAAGRHEPRVERYATVVLRSPDPAARRWRLARPARSSPHRHSLHPRSRSR